MDRERRQENAIEVRRKEEKQPRRLRKAQRGRQKTRWVWCHKSQEKGFEEGTISYIKYSRGLSNTRTVLAIEWICQFEGIGNP